jgi:hypothetical protein
MAEARQSSGNPDPVVGLDRLENAALEAFGPVVNPKAESLLGAIRCSSYFTVYHSGELVLDRRAFLLGVIQYGLSQPRKHSTSAWIVQWLIGEVALTLDGLEDMVRRYDAAKSNTGSLRKGSALTLSLSLEALLPTALDLARRSVRREVIDLRHLVSAFLISPGLEWDILPRRPTPPEFARLRRKIVAEITRHPEPGEDVAAWQATLEPAEVGDPAADDGDAAAATVTVEPGGTLVIDAHELHKMREAFLARFPDFEEHGFDASEGSYWKVERHYKQALIDAAADFLRLYEGPPSKIGTLLLQVLASKTSNLLDWREQRRLREVREQAPNLVEQALGEMVLSPLSPALSVARCVESIAEAYLRGREDNRPFADLRTLPTMVLALAKPKDAIAVRYTAMHRTAIRLTGGSLFRNAPMSAHEYQIVLDIAHHVEKVMRDAWGWRPRDLWDVQGFLWVAAEAEKSVEPPADDPAEEPGGRSIQDRYRTQADDPAMIDALERGPFAAVLAARIVEIRGSERTDEPEGDRAFMVHLHGPWGSGKSSILNLLRRELEQPREGRPSLVVMFNAWKQQRMRPPWWALMNAIYRGAIARCARSENRRTRWGERLRLWKLWWSWRWKAEWLPILLVGLALGGLTFALWGAETRGFVETATKIGVTAAAALAGVYAYARLMIFGSQKAVQTYADLTTDPYRRIVELFNRLVAEIRPPLVVFVDDLDRCDSDYVVELLEGIQTLFRHAPVTYVVAADRKWICSSFEKKYGDFAGSIGEPCRPLGYLFLDKLFQISAEMPRLTRDVQAS